MSSLLKLFLFLIAFFSAILLTIKFTGLITLDEIERWLVLAQSVSPIYLITLVVLLLLIDLLISIPTLIVCMLAGYFLGFGTGALAAMVGLSAAGIVGYTASRLFGAVLLKKVIRCNRKITEMEQLFHQHGFMMILFSRAIPMVPETAACMSGITRMPFKRFFLAWMLASYPYALITCYAGSVSSIDKPEPAFFIATGMMLVLGTGAFFFSRYQVMSKTGGLK